MSCDVSLKSLVFKCAVVVIMGLSCEYGASLKVIMHTDASANGLRELPFWIL